MEESKDATEGVKKIVERITRQIEIERDQRKKAIKDMLFVDSEDGQWDDDAKEKRADRPRYTIDLISGEIDRIVSNQRQTDLSITVLPGNNASKDTAKTINGIIRNIENNSKAENIYDAAFTEAVKGGYGGWRVYPDWDESDPFVQTIKMSIINSAASCLYFGKSEGFACEDAMWGTVFYDMDREEFKDEYPEATEQDFPAEKYSWAFECGWIKKDTIRVCEYFEKEPAKRKIGKLSDGRVIDIDDEEKVLDELSAMGIDLVDQKEIDSFKIKRYLINAVENLEPPKYIAGRNIPLIPLFGKTSFVEGKRFCRGVVRKAIDSQRIYNYSKSANIEAVALSPKDPFFATPTMVGPYMHQWNNFNVKSMPVMLFNPDPMIPGAKPERAGSPSVQNALIESAQSSKEDVYLTLGDDRIEARSIMPKSEGAVDSQQNITDSKSFVYQDNMLKAKEHTGRVILSIMQEVMDTERIEKIIGETGETEDVKINQTIIDEETLQPVIVNDVSLGTYTVVVKTGPTSPTKRKETVRQLNELVADDPNAKLLFGDLILDSMDINNAEEAKERVRKLQIKQGMVEPTEEEIKKFGLDQPPPPDPMQEELIKNVAMQTVKLESEIRNKEADTQNKLYESYLKSMKGLEATVNALAKKLEITGQLTPEDKNVYEGAIALSADAEIDTLRGNELAGSKSIDMKEAEQQQNMQPGQPQGEYNPTGPRGPIGPRPAPQMPEI